MSEVIAQSKLEEKYKRLTFAYNAVFNEGQLVKVVLDDLAEFCRAERSCFHADPRIHAVAEGRREVWLRIQTYINLTVDELVARNAKVIQDKEND